MSVGHDRQSCKTAEPFEMPSGMQTPDDQDSVQEYVFYVLFRFQKRVFTFIQLIF